MKLLRAFLADESSVRRRNPPKWAVVIILAGNEIRGILVAAEAARHLGFL